MRLVGERLEVRRCALGVDGCLDVDDVALLQFLWVAVQRDLLQTGQFLVHADDAVTAVVALADGDLLGVEEGDEGVESGEAGRVSEGWAIEEGRQDGF